MVGAAGLEPATLCLEGRCSIRLSYAPTSLPLLILNYFHFRNHPDSCFLRPNCIKTVSKPLQFGLPVSKLLACSLACRFSFCSASRFICNFICEYFLKTCALRVDPLVRDAASRKCGCIGGAQIVDPKIRDDDDAKSHAKPS